MSCSKFTIVLLIILSLIAVAFCESQGDKKRGRWIHKKSSSSHSKQSGLIKGKKTSHRSFRPTSLVNDKKDVPSNAVIEMKAANSKAEPASIQKRRKSIKNRNQVRSNLNSPKYRALKINKQNGKSPSRINRVSRRKKSGKSSVGKRKKGKRLHPVRFLKTSKNKAFTVVTNKKSKSKNTGTNGKKKPKRITKKGNATVNVADMMQGDQPAIDRKPKKPAKPAKKIPMIKKSAAGKVHRKSAKKAYKKGKAKVVRKKSYKKLKMDDMMLGDQPAENATGSGGGTAESPDDDDDIVTSDTSPEVTDENTDAVYDDDEVEEDAVCKYKGGPLRGKCVDVTEARKLLGRTSPRKAIPYFDWGKAWASGWQLWKRIENKPLGVALKDDLGPAMANFASDDFSMGSVIDVSAALFANDDALADKCDAIQKHIAIHDRFFSSIAYDC